MNTVITKETKPKTEEDAPKTFYMEFNSEYVYIDCDTWEDAKTFKTEAVLELLGLASPEEIVDRLPEDAKYDLLSQIK